MLIVEISIARAWQYSTTEKECLAIVLCLKEYRKMLYGGKLNIFIDYKNLTFKTLFSLTNLTLLSSMYLAKKIF